MSTLLRPVAALALPLVLALPGTAAAVSVLDYQSATSICQAARPELTQGLRFRPLGIDNDGTATAFLSCGLQTSDRWDGVTPTTRAALRFINRGTAPITVDCTFVYGAGAVPDAIPRYFPTSETIPAGGNVIIEMLPAGVEEPQLRFAQWSCALPPTGTLAYGIRVYEINEEAPAP